jgi:hypothetical protein
MVCDDSSKNFLPPLIIKCLIIEGPIVVIKSKNRTHGVWLWNLKHPWSFESVGLGFNTITFPLTLD